MLIISSKFNKTIPPQSTISIGGAIINSSSFVKDLGVIVDSKLNMEKHISQLCKSANYHLRTIGRSRKFLTKKATECLVHAFISSKLDYCNSLLYGVSNDQLKRLQYIQNTAARIITLTKKRSHITPVLKELHWLPRITFKLLVFAFKAYHQCGPAYLNSKLAIQSRTRNLRSSQQVILHQPSFNLATYGAKSYTYAAPKLFNSLPPRIKELSCLETFKSNVKTYLFNQAFPH